MAQLVGALGAITEALRGAVGAAGAAGAALGTDGVAALLDRAARDKGHFRCGRTKLCSLNNEQSPQWVL